MKTAEYLNESVCRVQAKQLTNGRFEISAITKDGESIVLLPESKKSPAFAQLFSARANGNCNSESHGKFFMFSKAKKSTMYPRANHLKSFIVEVA